MKIGQKQKKLKESGLLPDSRRQIYHIFGLSLPRDAEKLIKFSSWPAGKRESIKTKNAPEDSQRHFFEVPSGIEPL